MKNASLFTDVRDMFAAVLLATLALFIATAAPAKADTVGIACPIAQAKREMTDALPAGWSAQPIVSALSSTEVGVVGGQTALICRYGTSGAVLRNAPAGATCLASGTGFVCETMVVVIPPVAPADTGTVSIPHLGGTDLDAAGSTQDIKVVVTNPEFMAVISPANGARLATAKSSASGKAACQAANFKKKGVPATPVSGKNFVCYKTSDGRIGEFEIQGLTGGGSGGVQISFTTWN